MPDAVLALFPGELNAPTKGVTPVSHFIYRSIPCLIVRYDDGRRTFVNGYMRTPHRWRHEEEVPMQIHGGWTWYRRFAGDDVIGFDTNHTYDKLHPPRSAHYVREQLMAAIDEYHHLYPEGT